MQRSIPVRQLTGAALAILVALAWPTWSAPVSAQTVEESTAAAKAAAEEDALPLIATRTLEFRTDRASWLSVDLSPDGTALLFEILGDLYTMPVEGGEATRITSGQGYDMQPRYSPDGERIVFVSDRNGSENLWLAAVDGSEARALTSETNESFMSPVFTPDGEYVLAVKGLQLWMFHLDGGSGVQVTGQEDGSPWHLSPAFGADPQTLWVTVRGTPDGGFEAPDVWRPEFGPDHAARSSARQIGNYQIGELDRRTGELRIRTHDLEGAFRPVPSPDGRWVVYATRHDARTALKLLDLETGEERWLRMDVQRDESQGGGARDRDLYPGSAFTADSTALITTWGGRLWRVAIPTGAATEIPFAAQVSQELGPLVKFDYPIEDDSLTVTQIRGARPSPDGSRLAFTALDRLWVADLPAGRGGAERDAATATITGAVRLTDSGAVEHAPVWSPDGRWIAYVTWEDPEGGNIYRVRADGSGPPERLTPTAAFFDKIAWSPDGQRIAAVRGSLMHRLRTLEDFGGHPVHADLEYVWLPADGGQPTAIAWVGGGATEEGRNAPHFGPDPERIYVWAGREGLLSMRWDGTDARVVVKVTAPPLPGPRGGPVIPDEVLLSPDGRRALVRVNRNVYLITVPPVGGEAPTISVSSRSAVPTWRLTDIGGDFIGWTADGSAVHYSIGRSFFLWDPAIAEATTDAAEEAREAAEEESGDAGDDAVTTEEEETSEAATVEGDVAPGAARAEDDEAALEGLDYAPMRVDVEIVAERDKPTGTVAIRGARLITMRGNEVIESGDLVVRDNRIVAVGRSGEVEIPGDAHVIDAAGKTVMPGLVDIHAHTWVAWGVHRGQVSQFLAQLAYGVTTQRDPQTSSEDVLTYGDLVATGELLGPRIYSTGPGIFWSDAIGSLDEARDVLRRYADHFHTRTIKQYLAGDRKVRQWVITAARELGLTPTTEGGSNFTMNLTLMQDGYAGLEHSLPISPFFSDVTELGAFSGLTYTPTFIVAYGGPSGRQYYLTHTDLESEPRLKRFTPHDELDKWKSTTWYRDDQYVHPLHAEQLVKWTDAGGKAGLGSHGEVQGLGTHWELWMMASGGMDNHAALRMATLDSADAIGLAGDIGSLEPGKLADLLVLDENPLEDLHRSTTIRWVMKNGRLYESATLDEVWPRQRPLPEQWWWTVEPPDGDGGGD